MVQYRGNGRGQTSKRGQGPGRGRVLWKEWEKVVLKHPYRVLELLEYAHVQNVDLRNPIEEEFLACR